MTIFSTRPPRLSSTRRRRSCVMGRGSSTPSIRMAMALASGTPIQMGRKSWLPVSLRMTIGMSEEGSSINPLISMRSSSSVSLMTPLLCGPGQARSMGKRGVDPASHQAVRQGGFDLHSSGGPQRDGARRGIEMDHAMARGAAALEAFAPPPPGHQNLEVLPHEPLVDLALDPLLDG